MHLDRMADVVQSMDIAVPRLLTVKLEQVVKAVAAMEVVILDRSSRRPLLHLQLPMLRHQQRKENRSSVNHLIPFSLPVMQRQQMDHVEQQMEIPCVEIGLGDPVAPCMASVARLQHIAELDVRMDLVLMLRSLLPQVLLQHQQHQRQEHSPLLVRPAFQLCTPLCYPTDESSFSTRWKTTHRSSYLMVNLHIPPSMTLRLIP